MPNKIFLGFESVDCEKSKQYFKDKGVLNNNFIKLSQDLTLIEFDLLISSILLFNNLSFDLEFINNLSQKDEIALSGGLIFSNNATELYPGCCADFSDWKKNMNWIFNKSSPWMGHDPEITIKFEEDNFIAHYERSNENQIKYSYSKIKDIENEFSVTINHVLEVAKLWIDLNYPNFTKSFLENFSIYLNADFGKL